MPYAPGFKIDEPGHDFEVYSYWEKLVADYANISLLEVDELDYFVYLTLRHDAYIHGLEQTEKGEKYLQEAWRMKQTEPDRDGLRARFGKKGG